MKRMLCFLLTVIFLYSLSACGKKSSNADADPSRVPDASEENNPAEINPPVVSDDSAWETLEPPDSASVPGDRIDVDLTALSSTMVYSEVYNMMATPEGYVGKTIKASGQFAIYQAVGPDGAVDDSQTYFVCVIADATACCSQGMEFVLTGAHTYPDDYPELGTEITVVGTFQIYEEDGFLYCHLVDAKME